MENYIIKDNFKITGNLEFIEMSFKYNPKVSDEELQFIFENDTEIILIKFHSRIISFRQREHWSCEKAFNGEIRPIVDDYDNRCYVVENSNYIQELEKTSAKMLKELYNPVHYLIYDTGSEYCFDIITDTEPVLEKKPK